MYLEVELENTLEKNQCYPVGTGKGIIWRYWAISGSGTGKSVSITMVATVTVWFIHYSRTRLQPISFNLAEL